VVVEDPRRPLLRSTPGPHNGRPERQDRMKGEILLTGAGGQLGWDVQRRSTVHGVAVHGVAHAELDITDADAVSRVIDERRPRVVVNAASYTAVDKAESDALRAYAANADGPRNLARACFNAGIPLIHVSTDYVFDGK